MHAKRQALPHVFQFILRVTYTATAIKWQTTSNETEITAVKQQSPQNLGHPDKYIKEWKKKKMAEFTHVQTFPALNNTIP